MGIVERAVAAPRVAAELAGAAVTAGADLAGSGVRIVGSLEELIANLAETVDRVNALLDRMDRAADRAERLLDAGEAATQSVLGVAEHADEAVALLRQLPTTLGRIDTQVMPAVRSLGQLVPVVDTLNRNVEGLHGIVGEVGALLAGLPGSGRLLRRGGRPVGDAEGAGD